MSEPRYIAQGSMEDLPPKLPTITPVSIDLDLEVESLNDPVNPTSHKGSSQANIVPNPGTFFAPVIEPINMDLDVDLPMYDNMLKRPGVLGNNEYQATSADIKNHDNGEVQTISPHRLHVIGQQPSLDAGSSSVAIPTVSKLTFDLDEYINAPEMDTMLPHPDDSYAARLNAEVGEAMEGLLEALLATDEMRQAGALRSSCIFSPEVANEDDQLWHKLWEAPAKAKKARLPDGIDDTIGSDITPAQLLEFLKLNGHGSMSEGEPLPDSTPIADEEFPAKDEFAESIQKDEEKVGFVDWGNIKRTTIKLDDGPARKNLFKGRFWNFTDPNATSTAELLRRHVIEAGGWDYDEILQWQEHWLDAMSTPIRKWAKSGTSQALDEDMRIFIFSCTYHLWVPTDHKPKAKETRMELNSLFFPRKLTEATPFNHAFLRFPESAPTCPWRKYTTANILNIHIQMLKNRIAGPKSNVMKALRGISTPLGQNLQKNLTKGETDLLAAILKTKRAVGFRAFTKSAEFKASLGQLLIARETEQREKAQEERKPFVKELYFNALQAVKLEAWNRLSHSEQDHWRDYAKKHVEEDSSSLDESITAVLKLIVRALGTISPSAKMYSMLYTCFNIGDKPYVTVLENGDRPFNGISFDKSQYSQAHSGIISAFQQIASQRSANVTVERRKVETMQFWKEAADEFAAPVESDESLQLAHALPPLTFSKSDTGAVHLARNMTKWLGMALDTIHGFPPGTTSKESLAKYYRNNQQYFANLPVHKGRSLRLSDFAGMPDEELFVWRDHLADSFTKGSGKQNRFCFLDTNGKVPALAMRRRRHSHSDEGSSDEDKRQVKKSKHSKKPRRKAGRKRKMRHSSDSEQESIHFSDEELEQEEEEQAESHISKKQKQTTEGRKASSSKGKNAQPIRKSKRLSKKYVDDDDEDDAPAVESSHKGKGKQADSEVEQPKVPRTLPGSKEELEKKRPKPRPHHPISPFFQVKLMAKGTLPTSWTAKSFDKLAFSSKLYSWITALKPIKHAITHAHSSLPYVYPSLTTQALMEKEIAHPGLVDLCTHVALGAAWSDDHGFTQPFTLPPSPELTCDLAQIIFKGLHDLSLILPTFIRADSESIEGTVGTTLRRDLYPWLEDSLHSLQESSVILRGNIKGEDLLVLTRATWFVFVQAGQNPTDQEIKLYHNMINTFSGIAITRYSRRVISPICSELLREATVEGSCYKDLSALLVQASTVWNKYLESVLPSHIQLAHYLFTSEFPGSVLTPSEASALIFTLSQMPWWIGEPADYPRLVECSFAIPLLPLLHRIIHNWPNWKFFEKFTFFILMLAGCGSVINQSTTSAVTMISEDLDLASQLVTDFRDRIQSDIETAAEVEDVFNPVSPSMKYSHPGSSLTGSKDPQQTTLPPPPAIVQNPDCIASGHLSPHSESNSKGEKKVAAVEHQTAIAGQDEPVVPIQSASQETHSPRDEDRPEAQPSPSSEEGRQEADEYGDRVKDSSKENAPEREGELVRERTPKGKATSEEEGKPEDRSAQEGGVGHEGEDTAEKGASEGNGEREGEKTTSSKGVPGEEDKQEGEGQQEGDERPDRMKGSSKEPVPEGSGNQGVEAHVGDVVQSTAVEEETNRPPDNIPTAPEASGSNDIPPEPLKSDSQQGEAAAPVEEDPPPIRKSLRARPGVDYLALNGTRRRTKK